MTEQRFLSHSSEETFSIGYRLGERLQSNMVVCFFGELGVGKTTFIKGLVYGAAQVDPSLVQSPTFTYLNIYEGKTTVYHFDLYRLRDIDEFLGMGFDEYFDRGGICCVEWSERIDSYLSSDKLSVSMTHEGNDKRQIVIYK